MKNILLLKYSAFAALKNNGCLTKTVRASKAIETRKFDFILLKKNVTVCFGILAST